MPTRSSFWMGGLLAAIMIGVGLPPHRVCAADIASATVEFNRDIRPILADNCFTCHGPDENTREAELRLDLQEQALADRGGYRVILPGKLEESELYQRIASDDRELRMPPTDSGKSLTAGQIELLRTWIEQGAPWQSHWSFLPPERVEVPALAADAQVRNAIDAFIVARLEQQGLRLSPEADRRTLIRRLSFDLTGLPPTAEQVDAFVNDPSSQAYEELVDRLLASQHYGERLALYWLDLVRYADTNGIHGDNHREHSLYRDYVIQSFNANKPFDQFTIEQLAGDLLPDATDELRIASGYNRLNMTTREGGAQAKEYRAKYAADRVRNASTVWLGATLGCAECHDHKFDPYTSQDFYSFAAFFADLQETAVGQQQAVKMPTAQQQAQIQDLEQQMLPLQQTLDTQTPQLDAALVQWEQALRQRQARWQVIRPVDASSQAGAELKVAEDGSVLVGGQNPDTDVFTLTFNTPGQGITALRLDVLPDDTLASRGPGRAGNGNFVLSELEAAVDGQAVEWSHASATHSQDQWPVAAAIDHMSQTGWAILPKAGQQSHAVFEASSDLGGGEQASLQIKMHFQHGSQHTLGRFRLAVTTAPRPVRADGQDDLPKDIKAILAVDRGQRSQQQHQALAAHYRGIAPELADVRKRLAELQKQRDQIHKAAPAILIAMSGEPRVTRVLPRGNWLDDSGPIVQPAAPAFLKPLNVQGRRATRLDLANWLVSPDNPLVARVMVNRLWKIAFGQGLVKTMDDFGAQGSWPTHPRLLDWLAVEFRESGWDVKHMLKLLVMSAAYRQSSLVPESLRQRDPYNQLLARQNRFRLEAEMVRDNALAVSGLLVRKVGGPSVKPYQPLGYWAHLNFPKRVYKHDTGEDQYRRGLYTYWCRTFLHPSLLAFDAPSREECAVERPRSNTPLAALVLLNDPTYLEASCAFAERVMRESSGPPHERLHFAFRQALSRPPSEAEVRVLTSLWEKHLQQYRQDEAAAQSAVQVGQRSAPADLDLAELAAWTSVSRVVLNLHETITRN